jgi:chemotaxis protein MotC
MSELARALTLGASLSLSVLAPRPAAAALEPYQMVRSLQLVQDRIASGDHAALPMQQKLLQLIDKRLRAAGAEEFADRRNLEAMLIYGMSGGNPVTVDVVLSRFTPDDDVKAMAEGVKQYLRGDAVSALSNLQSVDPTTLRDDVGSFVALIKGSISAADEPAVAIRMFDVARLLGPGTLVEEAALRRSLPLAAHAGDTTRFLRAASQYVRRFLRSPYASQFADELVKGIVTLHGSLDLAMIEKTVSEMSFEHQKVIYLRLARTSAIEGLHDLSDFASAKAASFEKGPAGGTDDRAILYSSLSSVTSENADAILARLRQIDRFKLAGPDRQLLDAAISVASGVLTTPVKLTSAPPPEPAEQPEPSRPAAAEPHAAEPAAAEPRAAAPRQVSHAAPQAVPAETAAAGHAEKPATPRFQPEASTEASLPIVSETRQKLQDIDKMLSEAK